MPQIQKSRISKVKSLSRSFLPPEILCNPKGRGQDLSRMMPKIIYRDVPPFICRKAILFLLLVMLSLVGVYITPKAYAAIIDDAGCVMLCPGEESPPPRWERPVRNTTSKRSRVSAEESRAMRVASRGYKAWHDGKDSLADKYYTEAYGIYQNNNSIRRGYCTIKVQIAAKMVEVQNDYSGARRYLNNATGACSKYPESTQNIYDLRSLMNKKMQYARAKLQSKIGLRKVNRCLDEFIKSMDQFSSPPAEFKVAVPGTVFYSQGISNRAQVDIAEVQGKTDPEPKSFKMRHVPLPPEVISYYKKHDPFGGTKYGATKTTDLILDALEYGDGFIDDSLLYLTRKIREEGDYRHGIIALSYMQGLYLGLAKSGATLVPTDQQMQNKFIRSIYDHHTWDDEIMSDLFFRRQSGWIEGRRELVKEALKYGKGDTQKSLKYLMEEKQLKYTFYNGLAKQDDDDFISMMEDHIGWSAYYYILALDAYPSLMKEKKNEGK